MSKKERTSIPMEQAEIDKFRTSNNYKEPEMDEAALQKATEQYAKDGYFDEMLASIKEIEAVNDGELAHLDIGGTLQEYISLNKIENNIYCALIINNFVCCLSALCTPAENPDIVPALDQIASFTLSKHGDTLRKSASEGHELSTKANKIFCELCDRIAPKALFAL